MTVRGLVASRRIRGTLLLVGLGVATWGCSAIQLSPSTSGGTGATGAGVRVQYLVRCLECAATYSTAEDMEAVQVEGSWTRTISVAGREQVTLTIAAGEKTTHLEGQIEVDGRLAAQDRIQSTSRSGRSLHLVASVSSQTRLQP